MKFVVVGNGKVGTTLTVQLAREGHDIIIVDNDERVIENVVNAYDVMGICGNGGSYDVLQQAGVATADLFIAVTSGDEMNILSCMLAKKMGAKHTIARVRNPQYTKLLVYMRDELGLSMSINPEFEAANEIFRVLRLPQALEVDSFSKGRVDLVAVRIQPNSKLNGKAIAGLQSFFKANILICAVERNGEVIIPDGDFVMQCGDKIFISATSKELDLFFKETGIISHKIRKVMIIGGGKIAYYLARQLISLKVNVKIIELNKQRSRELSELLPKATVVYGDGTDQAVLTEEGIRNVDACVALTDNDEENIILSMYAGTQKVEKIITKVNRIPLLKIMQDVGIESVISPKMLTANHIVRYVRAMETTEDNSIRTLYKIVDGQAEAIEFPVTRDSGFVGHPLRELNIRKNNLIACIIRKGRIIFPNGDAVMEAGDNVVVVTTTQSLKHLKDILDGRE